MISLFSQLVARDGNTKSGSLSTPTIDLLISLLALILLALAVVGALLVLRRKRQSRNQQSLLPIHNGQCSSHQRQLTLTTGNTDSVLVYDEKRNLMETANEPSSPVPEIRITFPEEEDESGKRKSGRVVVVRISDAGSVGLEPCREDLPPYQTTDTGRFHSLDIERMGGLKEKEDIRTYA